MTKRLRHFSVAAVWYVVKEHRAATSHNGNVDVTNDDNDIASCSESTPGGSRHCSVVPVATVAMTPPPYDAVVDIGSQELCAVTSVDQQVRPYHHGSGMIQRSLLQNAL